MIVVDFYSGNTFQNPGPENCNPQRCGGVLVQFSEPVLIVGEGEIIIDVTANGLITCIERFSREQPSPFRIFSGAAWVEPGDTIHESRMIQNGMFSVTDESGNEVDSYNFGGPVSARVSDFAMVEGPTPVPTPIPPSVRGERPRVVSLHLSELVRATADNISDIKVNVRLADDTVVSGSCVEPCDGSDAELSFDVPELDLSAIAMSFDLTNGAEIRDTEGFDIITDLREVMLDTNPRIVQVRSQSEPSDTGEWHPIGKVHFEFSSEVWIDALDA